MKQGATTARAKRNWSVRVTPALFVALVDVDTLSKTDCVQISTGDTILWYSSSCNPFRITDITKKAGKGPPQPFQKHFPNGDPGNDQVYSGRAIPAAELSKYKYTVTFDDGAVIDPDVVIDQ